MPESLASSGEQRSLAISEPLLTSEQRGRSSTAEAKTFWDDKGQGNLVLPTAVRKNITTRRSRGRKEELSGNPQALAMKRPKGRSRDRKYTRQSVGSLPSRVTAQAKISGHEMLRRTKVRIAAEMKAHTDQRIAALLSPPARSLPERHSTGSNRQIAHSTDTK
jgi:hypothetical protein